MAYSYVRAITFDHTKVESTDQTDFPALFSGTYSYLATVGNGGLVTNSNGYDIAFATDIYGLSMLDWEVESYDAVTGTIRAWIRIPTLSSSVDTVIYVLYGNPSITTFQGNVTGTWDSHFKGVYHLPNGTSLDLSDSTGNNSSTNHSATATAGQVDGAAGFVQASSQYVDLGSGLNLTGNITLEAWVKFTGSFQANVYPRIISDLDGPTFNGYELLLTDTTDPHPNRLNFQVGNGGTLKDAHADNALVIGTIYHVVATYDGTTGKLYINGILQGETFSGASAIGSSTKNANLSRWPGQPIIEAHYWNGFIDEARVSDSARSADWITTEYNNQSTPASFYSIGGVIFILNLSDAVSMAALIGKTNEKVVSDTVSLSDMVGVTTSIAAINIQDVVILSDTISFVPRTLGPQADIAIGEWVHVEAVPANRWTGSNE